MGFYRVFMVFRFIEGGKFSYFIRSAFNVIQGVSLFIFTLWMPWPVFSFGARRSWGNCGTDLFFSSYLLRHLSIHVFVISPFLLLFLPFLLISPHYRMYHLFSAILLLFCFSYFLFSPFWGLLTWRYYLDYAKRVTIASYCKPLVYYFFSFSFSFSFQIQ